MVLNNVAGDYVRRILKERNMTQADLIRKMREMKLSSDKTLQLQKLNNWINSAEGQKYTWARRIELALGLEDYVLVKMKGNPTPKEWKRIERIGKEDVS